VTITAEQISKARRLLRWSQQDLALRARISQSSVARIERGNTPSDKIGIKIRRAFEFAGVEFINGDNPGANSAPELLIGHPRFASSGVDWNRAVCNIEL
jgi:transcriptional regulator with XRE-family HTH domain